MQPTRLAFALAALALAAGAASSSAQQIAAHTANTKQDRAALRRDRMAGRLINKAVNRVNHEHRACRPAPQPRRSTFTDAAPSDALLGTIGVLRRPAEDRDRIDPGSLAFFGFARGIYSNWIRAATAADGHEFVVIVAQDRLRPRDIPHRCIELQNAELDRLLEGRSAELRRVTLRIKRHVDRTEHPRGGFKPKEAIFLFERTPDGDIGGGGGGVDLAFFRRYGLFGFSGAFDRTTVSGLVPDGVASIDFVFARRVSRGPHRDPKVYPHAIRLTVPVQENVVSFEVDRPLPGAFPTRMTWRAADGSVVRVVRAPRG